MRVSTETYGSILLSCCSRCLHVEPRSLFVYDLVSGSPFLGVWVLLVEFGTLDSSGDDFVQGAMLGSTLDTLSAPD